MTKREVFIHRVNYYEQTKEKRKYPDSQSQFQTALNDRRDSDMDPGTETGYAAIERLFQLSITVLLLHDDADCYRSMCTFFSMRTIAAMIWNSGVKGHSVVDTLEERGPWNVMRRQNLYMCQMRDERQLLTRYPKEFCRRL